VGFDLGSLIGGFVGAGGAVFAVYLLIRQQRREEANNVSRAIRREVIVLSEILISHLQILAAIKSGAVTITRNKLRSAIMNPDPTIRSA
jgi:ABC-type Fe3+-siderophore transport system permease subunit